MEVQIRLLMEKVASQLSAPFASWDSFLSAIWGVPDAILNVRIMSAWPYLISSMVLVYVLYRMTEKRKLRTAPVSFRSFAFPRKIYRHRSAMVDYKFALIDLTIQGVVYAPLIGGCAALTYKLALALTGAAAAPAAMNPVGDGLLLTLTTFVLADFGFFLSHYLMHRLPLLWYFHEVHHSAEVMTPVTVLRVHPVEKTVSALTSAFLGGLGAAAYAAILGHQVNPVTVAGINIFVFYFFVFASHLRHSHIWFSYGIVLSHILISPAQHQIHHSIDPKHYDKNYGYVLAIWDLMLRSLYVPRARESLQFGLAGTDPRDFSTVGRLYFLPFRKAMRHWRAAKPDNPGIAIQPDAVSLEPFGHNLHLPEK